MTNNQKRGYEGILNALNIYLMQEFNYRKPFAKFGLSNNVIVADRKKVDLYLRFFSEPKIRKKPTIVIARIAFSERRKGHGKRFLHFISKIAIENKYEFIELESCNLDSVKFAKLFGFKPLDKGEKNHRIDVANLLIEFR